MKQKQGAGMQGILVALVLSFGFAGGAWAHPSTPCGRDVSREGKVITVKPKPHGCQDNTANLQCAIDLAVAAGRGSVVQLTRGKFCTAQLVATNFKGTIRGEGMKGTTIEALPNLPVKKKDNWVLALPTPPSGDNPWPSLLTFVNGDIAVRDLAIQIVEAQPTTGWLEGPFEIKALAGVLYVVGTRADLRVSRISLSGVTVEDVFGFNVFNGVVSQGGLTQSPPLPPLVGLYEVRDSRFSTVASATGVTTRNDSEVVVENNTFHRVLWAGQFGGVSNTSVRFVNNEVDNEVSPPNKFGFAFGIEVANFPLSPPYGFTDSRLLIAHNKFKGTTSFGAAVGITATFSGKNSCLVVLNDTTQVRPVDPDPTFKPIFLGPGTKGCLVVTRKAGTVNDQGENNRIITVPRR